jgi:hypothetical protein
VQNVIEFVEPGDVEGFRPLDLALSHDGNTLYIADWSFGGWANKNEKLGRVYVVTYAGSANVKTRPRVSNSEPISVQIAQLDHPSFQERFRAQLALIKHGTHALSAVTSALAYLGTCRWQVRRSSTCFVTANGEEFGPRA